MDHSFTGCSGWIWQQLVIPSIKRYEGPMARGLLLWILEGLEFRLREHILWLSNKKYGKTMRFDSCIYIYIPVVPGQAGGGSFQKEKKYIAQKEFAYRMCARRPTSAMPKSFLCCERAFCRSMVVMFCALKWSVLMSWCLLRGQVMWWSRHLMRCDGLCCVMSRDAKRCHGDELYYSSTTLYYKVLLQYYSVLQILLCTTLYYKVLFQYRLPWTTKYYSSTTLYYSSTTLYYKVLLQY